MSEPVDLEQRLLRAVHDADADLELLAHELAGSEDAQAYLVELIATLSAISPTSPAADRAAALLEHGLAIAAEHGDVIAEETEATQRGASEIKDGKHH